MITTKGWNVKVFWNNKSTYLIPLAEIIYSNPIGVAEVAIAFKHDREYSFNWWVQKAISKHDRLIGELQVARCCKGKMKFGVDIPSTVKEAVSLDEAKRKTLWQDAIKLDMKNSTFAFKLYQKGDKAPVGHTKTLCHLLFDL